MGVVVQIKNHEPVYTGDFIEIIVAYPTFDGLKERVLNTNSALRFIMIDEDQLPVSFSYDDFDKLEFKIIGYKKAVEECVISYKRLGMD